MRGWTNPFEEQSDAMDSIKVYRPNNFKTFQGAWPARDKFELYSDSSCRYLVLSETDKHLLISGARSIDTEDTTIIVINDLLGNIYRRFRGVELKRDLLKYYYIVAP